METEQEIALTEMRKSVEERLGSSTTKYGELTLMRFLIARAVDPSKAANMFVQWHKWRASFVPNGFISESEVKDELDSRKIYLQSSSKDGYPVMIVKTSKHFPAKDRVQFKKFVVHLLDKAIASSFNEQEVGNEKIIAVIDLQHITLKNIDPRGLITGFQLLQDYYPERLAKCYILHMPKFFVSVWKLVCRFLEKATLEKIVIVSNEDEQRDFIREVGEDSLPENYGGRAKLMAVQDVMLPTGGLSTEDRVN